ncbi:MAG: helix-turn-helix domain-containing protein [Clostridia bacterium]|nr:helix-turn-helix domain-containing protein [Clostridia bacterium]
MSDVKNILASNLVKLRLKNNLTQSDIAEKLNYSDKSVSKWEQGAATPPIDTLKRLAEMYNVSVDFLLTESTDEEFDKIANIKDSQANKTNKIIITLLAIVFVWLFALLTFFYYTRVNVARPWKIFIFAVPLSMITLLIFNKIWGKRENIFIIVSALIWSIITYIYIRYLDLNLWMVFIIGVPLQIATILWSQLKRPIKNK